MSSVDMEDAFEISNVVELLIEWKFSEEIQLSFLNAGIELHEFLTLNLTKLRDYVLDAGDRLRLVNKIFEYKRAHNADSAKECLSPKQRQGASDFDTDQFLNTKDRCDGSDSENEPLSKKPKTNGQQGNSKRDSKANNPTSSKSTEGDSQNSNAESGAETTSPEKNGDKASGASTSKSVPPRLKSIITRNKFKDFDLLAYLQATQKRSSILVGNKNGILSTENRKYLIQVLGDYILAETSSPTPDDFMIIREKIGVLFPNEPLNLIYQAPQESDRTQALARGMLFYRVRNEISKLISKKVIQPRRRRKVLDDSFESEEVDNPSTEIEGLVQILKRAREVTSEVERNWEKTAEFRLQKLNTAAKKEKQKGKGKKKDRENQPADTVQDYINDYKVLRHPQAHKLLELDFKHLYEEESGNLLSEWSNFLSKIEQLALNSRIEDQVGKELVSILKTDESDLDDNNKDALLLQILPSLCPPTARVTVGKKTYKPSTPESRDAFISYTTVGADLEPLIARRKERMVKLNATQQPYMIFLGPKRSDIIATYVVVDNILYKVDSVIKCLDICFKVFHTLCASYPMEANHLWHFIHLYLYKIKPNPVLDGVVPLATTSFIAKLSAM